MTHVELVERQQAFQRAARGRMTPFLFVFIPVLAPLVVGSFKGIDVDRWGVWPEVAAFAALVATLATATIFVPQLEERRVRKFGLACPSCGEALLGTTGEIAAVTGRCGVCGHRVVEPESS
ncbi:MAG TPA: hypothetical protein VH394_25720 [Thermoanaerobaculia bacterium]|jgi:ribosomal protein S27E|nr:hypothetical protein [Thermoanaerobaculia bacterium]